MKRDDFAPPESAYSLWYDPFLNRFKDESGAIRNDLSLYFPTWVLDKWKKTKNYGILKDRRGDVWEIFYRPACEHVCMLCKFKCDIYDMIRDW